VSMYGLVHGENAAADFLLGILNLTKGDVGRFRDAWVNKAGETYEIAIYTRNGGGNRDHYDDDIQAGDGCHCTGCTIEYQLPVHPLYLRDEDDDFDCTYATVFFRVPAEVISLVSDLAENRDPGAKWAEAIEALKAGKRPDVVEAFAPLFKAISEHSK
jgi:hypothetical protein